jgi:hypothetical protein
MEEIMRTRKIVSISIDEDVWELTGIILKNTGLSRSRVIEQYLYSLVTMKPADAKRAITKHRISFLRGETDPVDSGAIKRGTRTEVKKESE